MIRNQQNHAVRADADRFSKNGGNHNLRATVLYRILGQCIGIERLHERTGQIFRHLLFQGHYDMNAGIGSRHARLPIPAIISLLPWNKQCLKICPVLSCNLSLLGDRTVKFIEIHGQHSLAPN